MSSNRANTGKTHPAKAAAKKTTTKAAPKKTPTKAAPKKTTARAASKKTTTKAAPKKTTTKAAPKEAPIEIKGPNKTGNAIFVGSLVSAAAVTGSLATEPDGQWYRELNKPVWQPPGVAFPVVWSSLYTDIAVSSTAVLNELERRGETEEAAAYRKALATNLALNAAWSWLFFRWHHLGAATAGAGVLAISSIDLAKRAGHARPAAGWALGVYALWTAFAAVLAGTVCWLNPKDK